jgi:YidC/Oxa1 family membrane protein insertase
VDTFHVFFELIARVLAFYYELIPSFGFAIIALTLTVMVILTPLTLKGTRSMMMMQQLQPEMKKLQSKYKDDRQQLNEELMKFYKENNINPLGGCLPLLVQMPVFIVLYNVLRGLTLRVPLPNPGFVSGQLAIGQTPTRPPNVNFDPAYLDHNSSMYQAMSQTNVLMFFGMDLSESCSEALQLGVVHALPYIVLIAIVGVSGFVQQRQIQGRTPNAQVNPQQQTIMKIMPIFLPVISFGLPSGLVLYFAVSNLYRIGQQWFISRSIYGIKRGDKPAGGSGGSGGGGGKGGPKGSPSSGGDAKSGGIMGMLRPGPRDGEDSDSNGSNGNGSSRSREKVSGTTKTASKSTAASKSPAKAGGAAGAKTSNGRTTPSKAAANTGSKATTAGSRAGSDKAKGTPTKKPTSSSRDDAPKAAPTLQPRARKNKKR